LAGDIRFSFSAGDLTGFERNLIVCCQTTKNVILSPSLFVILNPSLPVILNEVKNLKALRINFAKDLIFMSFPIETRFFAPTI